jgi:hypothetical protein
MKEEMLSRDEEERLESYIEQIATECPLEVEDYIWIISKLKEINEELVNYKDFYRAVTSMFRESLERVDKLEQGKFGAE